MKQDDPAPRTKSFEIPKRLVGEAWKLVWANQGASGVDRETLKAYKTDLESKLYILWNRMSSGSYFPSPVRQVLIPKGEGQVRLLNVKVRGWIGYYGAFYPEPLKRFLVRIDLNLGRWARNKYKRLRGHKRRTWQWLRRIREKSPKLFVHWDYLFSTGA